MSLSNNYIVTGDYVVGGWVGQPSQNLNGYRNLLDKLVQYGQQKVKEAKQANPPAEKPKRGPLPRQMADPEVVKKVLARAKHLLTPSPEKLKAMPRGLKTGSLKPRCLARHRARHEGISFQASYP